MKIYLWGLMGSGKSFIGKQLAEALGWQFLDLDAEIEASENRSIADIFDVSGSSYFRDAEHDALLKTTHLHRAVIATGGGAPAFFDNADFMLHSGTCVWLYSPIPVIVERLWTTEHTHRPLLKGRDKLETETLLANLLQQRQSCYRRAHYSVRSDAKDVLRTLQTLI